MENTKFGALSDQGLIQCLSERIITNALEKNIGPSSLDLSIDLNTLVEIPCVFLPSKKVSKIKETLRDLGAQKVVKNNDGYFLKRGKVYVAKINEQVRFPMELFGYANPKSSTGRSDIHVQLIGDFITQYDRIPKRWSGDLYVIMRSHSFNITFPEASVSLNQLRVFSGQNGILSQNEILNLVKTVPILRNDHKKTNLLLSDFVNENRIELSLDLRDWGSSDCLGFVAKQNVSKNLIWKVGENKAEDFFEPIQKIKDNRAYMLEKNRFYILSSRESVQVPREYACEMVSFNELHGEIRAHYAGFIDNGWGQKNHRPLTLEVRPYEPLLVYHGQPIASLVFHKMYSPVIKGYDEITTSNYINQQTARLGKFFV